MCHRAMNMLKRGCYWDIEIHKLHKNKTLETLHGHYAQATLKKNSQILHLYKAMQS